MHHAFKGGLLEHTLQMLQTGETLLKLPFYAEVLNKDLCLFGLMMHDFSKIFEYSPTAGFKKTIHGVLVSHIPKTACLIELSADKFGVPDEIKDHLQHVVLAHHGCLEYGSPVDMATPEAMFVHYIDNLHGDIFGVVQKMATEVPAGAEIWKHPVTRKNLVVKRFNEVLKEYET
jgi:3'-5' exoribonuclease